MNKTQIVMIAIVAIAIVAGGLYVTLAFGRDDNMRDFSGKCLSFEMTKDLFGKNCTVVVLDDGERTVRLSFEGHFTVRPTYTVELRYWLKPWHLHAELKYMKQTPPP
jgi:hypothetical protein